MKKLEIFLAVVSITLIVSFFAGYDVNDAKLLFTNSQITDAVTQ